MRFNLRLKFLTCTTVGCRVQNNQCTRSTNCCGGESFFLSMIDHSINFFVIWFWTVFSVASWSEGEAVWQESLCRFFHCKTTSISELSSTSHFRASNVYQSLLLDCVAGPDLFHTHRLQCYGVSCRTNGFYCWQLVCPKKLTFVIVQIHSICRQEAQPELFGTCLTWRNRHVCVVLYLFDFNVWIVCFDIWSHFLHSAVK